MTCFTHKLTLPFAAFAILAAQAAVAQDTEEPSDLMVDPATPEMSDIADSVDPIVRQDIMELRSSGVVALQSKIGTELITIDRLQARAAALEGLLGTLGVDGLKQFDPEIYEAMKDSPLVLNQMIEELKLRQELEAIQNGTDEEVVAEAADEGQRFGPPDVFQQAPFAPVQDIYVPQEPIAAPVVEDMPMNPLPVIDVPQLTMDDFADTQKNEISLREIYGGAGVFKAVILHGEEVMKVEAGDRLPNDTEILTIQDDRITVRRGDTTFEVFLRG